MSDGEIPVKEANVATLISLKGTHVYWLKSTCPLSALQTVNQRTVILRARSIDAIPEYEYVE